MSGGLILAAPASGSGKTTLTLGLLRSLRRRGLDVASAKVGLDYIDPAFHAAATGAPCRNLDPWAMRGATLLALAARLEAAAPLVLCEGVMGLFDGAGSGGASGWAGSTAELAAITGWPVVLVVDAAGQGASVAALLRGFAGHAAAVPLAGVVFNRVASPRHAALLDAAVRATLPDLPILGHLPRAAALALPSRHLGLVPAAEHPALEPFLEAAADAVDAALDIPALTALARPGRRALAPMPVPIPVPVPPLGQRIAVARDIAFAFAYPALIEGWRVAGAELGFFSPLAEEAPDPAADAIFLPGGYPELHAGRLAGNAGFLEGLRAAARRGAVVYGECGGYMVLGHSLVDAQGEPHAMAGLLPLVTSFAERRRHLGYRRLALRRAGPLGAAGTAYRGHEFHYASIVSEGADVSAGPGVPEDLALFDAADAEGATIGSAGLARGGVMGSFMHLVDRA